MKLFTLFENFVKENSNSNYEKFNEEDKRWSSYNKYVVDIISKKLGKPNFYSGSADWGGADVWTLKGDSYVGTFLAFLDNELVILERPETFGNEDDEEDTIIDIVDLSHPYVNDNSDELFAIIDKAIAIKNS